jgi:TonB family protein
MKPLSMFIALISICILTSLPGSAQDAANTETLQQTGVVLVKLSPPLYPPLARQARIQGDVKVYVHVRKDGSVESAELFSGHPMLAATLLESARKSRFECRGCGDEVSPYPMTYTFGFLDDGKSKEVVTERPARTAKCLFVWQCGMERTTTWQCPDTRPAEMTESHGHVTILVSTACIETQSCY